jgi:hypothetical protein
MASKINSKTRIKIRYLWLASLREELKLDMTTHVFELLVSAEAGLVRTSTRWAHDGYTYYYKVVDKQKFFLAKFKYGI